MVGSEVDWGMHPGSPCGDAYEVVRELGRGGMAIVYLVRERSTGRERAMKVIHSRFLGDTEAVARFAREARLVAELHHPGIVPIHSVEHMGGAGLALVMDRVPGRTVKQIIRAEGPMSFDRVERILADISDALGYAHSQGVVHRDVKPENIFVDETTGRALLSDFGIARSIDSETHLTLAGVTIGTPTYMAPEQIDTDVVDGRSDLYSLGVVGWEMITGSRPWDGETLYKVIYRQKHDDLAPLDTIRPDTPVRLIAAIEGLLEKSPGDRWQSAAQFKAQLTTTRPVERRERARRTDVASDDTVMIRRPTRGWFDERRRRTTMQVGLAVAAAGLLVSTTLVFARPEPTRNAAPTRSSADRASAMGALRATNAAREGMPARSPVGGSTLVPPGAVASAAADDSVAAAASAANLPYGVLGDTALAPSRAPAKAGERLDRGTTVAAPAAVLAPLPQASAVPQNGGAPASPAPASTPRVVVAHATERGVGRRFSIAPGASDTCLLSPEGAAYCWGGNSRGQLGSGAMAASMSPVGVESSQRFSMVVPGLSHTCALTTGGSAYCWGGNEHGQLGDGVSSSRSVPGRVAGAHDFISIASGAQHSCAVTDAGRAYCWGSGARGQLGNGVERDSNQPVAVSRGLTFVAVAAGWNHTCALTDGGVAYCWGSNEAGELGNGAASDSPTPVEVRTSARFIALTAGSAHTCGITSSGVAYCWGNNRYGQLGGAAGNAVLVPTAVSGGARFVAIAAGGVHTCAVTSSHEAWCWGRNNYGQLGDGTTTDRGRPVQVSGGHDFVTVGAFGAHTCGTTTTDELFCWGYNLDGQLGDGTREHRMRPVYVEKPRA